jgi:hypothetical protein
MRTLKAMLLASVLAALSLTSGLNESFAGVTTAAAVTPAVTTADGGTVDQVRWYGRRWGGGGCRWGGCGYGWRRRGWGGGYGWGGGGYYGGGCWRWGPWGRVWVC